MTEDEGTANEEIDEDMASEIIVSTCQLLPKTFSVVSDHMRNLIASKDPAPTLYSISCGSFAEFYIRPLNPCITDTDFLTCSIDTLVLSGDFPVLPTDKSGLADTILFHKIESCQRYPGYVRLRYIGVMKYNWKYKMYELYHRGLCLLNAYAIHNFTTSVTWLGTDKRNKSSAQGIINGPAVQVKQDDDEANFAVDVVQGKWCPQWPKEAQNWPLRPRHKGWPTTTTISEVMQNGCHVVYAQHRSCRNDKLQWRLSFSFAEVILLQSWSQVQQIAYHLLRFLAKRELIQNNCPKEDEVLCTYHLKTLMLWTCEEMPTKWWRSATIIAICCELLKKLFEWLKNGYCPNYFIPEANLFNEQWNQKLRQQTESQLNKFCKSTILCDWFVENYIRLFTRRHIIVKEVTNRRDAASHLMDCILLLFKFRKDTQLESLNMMLSFRFKSCHVTCRHNIKHRLTAGLRQSFDIGCGLKNLDARTSETMSCLPTIEKVLCFTYYDNVLHILHAAYGIGCGEISWENRIFVDLVIAISMQPKVIRSHYHNFPKAYTAQGGRVQFLYAYDLLKNLAGLNSFSEFRLLVLMAKEFLRRALEYENSESNGIAPTALAYLAALHFATAEYQLAIRFCQSVLSDQTFQKDEEILNAGCLLFIDDIARIVGLCLLHTRITENDFQYNARRLYLDLRLSSDVFACCLLLLSAESIFKCVDFHHNLPGSSFPIDEYFKTLIKSKHVASMTLVSNFSTARQIVYRRPVSLAEANLVILNSLSVKETILNLLLEYALDNMSFFETVLGEDFDIQFNVVDCYRALYLYNCRKYEKMISLCQRILCEPDVPGDLKEHAFANVLLLPPLDSFFDREVQSLLGFHTLYYYLSPLKDEMSKCVLTAESLFAHWFALEVYYCGMQLSASISSQNRIYKYHYFLGRQFVARYLKVRCCIDCNLPYTEAITDFVAQKAKLPFERIIRRFLLRKLHVRKI